MRYIVERLGGNQDGLNLNNWIVVGKYPTIEQAWNIAGIGDTIFDTETGGQWFKRTLIMPVYLES